MPVVVNDDVLVPGLAQSAGDEGFGGLLDDLGVDRCAEHVPTVPAHWGRCSKHGSTPQQVVLGVAILMASIPGSVDRLGWEAIDQISECLINALMEAGLIKPV